MQIMNKFLTVITAFTFTFTIYGQSDVKMRLRSYFLSNRIDLLIPHGVDKYIYFEYIQFKGVYFSHRSDTLVKVSDNLFAKDSIKLDIGIDFISKDSCDPAVNEIRNEAFWRIKSAILKDSATYTIGRENQKFKSLYLKSVPNQKELCHHDFQERTFEWLDEQYVLINQILREKQNRYQSILLSETVNYSTIMAFLRDFGNCEPDNLAVLELISKNADDFIRVCKNKEYIYFWEVKGILSEMPASINRDAAINSLKKSKIWSVKKWRLRRVLEVKAVE